MSKKSKRVLAIGDFHCGQRAGLTPPQFDNTGHTDPHHHAIRRTTWDWYEKLVQSLKPQIVIFNGDAIDGKGQASGGTELLYADRNVQVDMAVACLKAIPGSPKIVMSYGTAYHTGKEEDFEDKVADGVNAYSIGGEDVIDVNGLLINYRHHLGSSSVPHGRATAISKEVIWNKLWAIRGEYPMADVVLRSHVHYHVFAGGPGWLGMSLPALQGYGSKYGGRRMSGTVDVGAVWFDIKGKQEYTWNSDILRYPAAVAPSL
jgi:predicted MPP superfamily phosphohydrolase